VGVSFIIVLYIFTGTVIIYRYMMIASRIKNFM